MAYCARGVGKTESHFLLTYLGKTSAVLGRGNHMCGGERGLGGRIYDSDSVPIYY